MEDDECSDTVQFWKRTWLNRPAVGSVFDFYLRL